MEAVKKGDLGEIKRLIDEGVDVNSKDSDGGTGWNL
jgi:ankyrin repeat protein